MASAPNTPLPDGVSEQQVQQVIAALEKPDYQWRTVGGVAADVGLTQPAVKNVIRLLEDQGVAIKSSVDAEDGSELFTTRRHYQRKAPLWDRFMAAVRNRSN